MSPKTIRARTLECIHLAQHTENAHHKSLLLDVAHSCADLANALDRFQVFAQAAETRSYRARLNRVPRAAAGLTSRSARRRPRFGRPSAA
jgi:uncharacterized protein (DUF885 family)